MSWVFIRDNLEGVCSVCMAFAHIFLLLLMSNASMIMLQALSSLLLVLFNGGRHSAQQNALTGE